MTKEQSVDLPETKKQFRFKKRDLLFVIVGVFLAFILRFTFVDSNSVHYHANFSLYVNGVRDDFKSPTFYEEISACSEGHNDPKTRSHMHDNESDVIHVHDSAVTWGHFFANISYTLSDKVLVTDGGTFVDGVDGKNLHFILNGKQVSSLTNRVIANEDKLLIDYSADDASTLASRYGTISSSAHEHNVEPDPASCSGGAQESMGDRFKRTLGTLPKVDKH